MTFEIITSLPATFMRPLFASDALNPNISRAAEGIAVSTANTKPFVLLLLSTFFLKFSFFLLCRFFSGIQVKFSFSDCFFFIPTAAAFAKAFLSGVKAAVQIKIKIPPAWEQNKMAGKDWFAS